MRSRCYDVNHKKYPLYGGRGIVVCDRWRYSFLNFYEDMGPKPTPKHQIDRIDNDGNYEPSNCRWVTNKENNRNRGDNTILEYGGKRLCIAAWAEELGVDQQTIGTRLIRGWSIERTLTTKKQKRFGK